MICEHVVELSGWCWFGSAWLVLNGLGLCGLDCNGLL